MHNNYTAFMMDNSLRKLSRTTTSTNPHHSIEPLHTIKPGTRCGAPYSISFYPIFMTRNNQSFDLMHAVHRDMSNMHWLRCAQRRIPVDKELD